MNKLSKKDAFTLYVFIIVMSSTLISIILMTFLETIFNENKTLNYVIFLCICFLLSSVVASLVISNLAKRAKSREELYEKLIEKVTGGEFDFRFPMTGDEQLDFDIKNFNTILEQLSSITILKEDFISNFSHEFKTPITSIKGFAEILQSKKNLTDEERKEYLQIIIDESGRLADLSKNILLIGKLDSQVVQEHKEVYLLDEQIAEIVLFFDSQFSEKNITTDIDLDRIKICACKELLGHVWTNILSNAIKFTNDEIQIKAFVDTNDIVVKITDNGIGMTKEDSEHIFDKYYQIDTSHKKNGTGLGLSIASKVIQIVGGQIEVESAPNQGTTFTVKLPNELNGNKV